MGGGGASFSSDHPFVIQPFVVRSDFGISPSSLVALLRLCEEQTVPFLCHFPRGPSTFMPATACSLRVLRGLLFKIRSLFVTRNPSTHQTYV